MSDPVPLLSLRDVSRTFGRSSTGGVRGITFDVRRGEFVAVVGPSGAGKSTLLDILGLLDRPTDGSYLIDGVATNELREGRRNILRSRLIGFVFQSSFVLGHQSVGENAATGLRIQGRPLKDRRRLTSNALASVGIGHRADLDARLLSGGERQRLAIARAVATRPDLILADEPTGNLDSANGESVLDQLLDLNATGTTVVLITHDPTIAARAERRIRIADGRVIEDTGARPTSALPSPPPRPETAPRRSFITSAADVLGDSLGALAARPLRTALLVLAFALGVGGLIAALGVSESASAQVSERLTAAALDEVRVTVPGGAELLAAEDGRLDSWLAATRALPHVVDAGFVAQTGAEAARIRRLASTDPEPAAPLQLISADPTYLRLVGASAVGPDTRGLLATPGADAVALLGSGAASTLAAAAPGPGSTVEVLGIRAAVAGTLIAGERAPGIDGSVVVSRDILARAPSVAVTILVRTDPGFPAPLAEALPLALDPGDPGRFTVETVADLRALRYGVATDLGALIGLIGVVLLVLATISASTTMYVSVQARAAEIALRRAIGASRGAVARLFVGEGLVVGVIGGVTGAVLGTAATLATAAVQGWSPLLPPALTPLSIALGAVTGVVSAIVPAWAAGRQEPASALRA
ncbi:hypothetical protein C5C24_02415 [Rathayibacter sp. AY2B3]|nr:hypothetical protein C5C24_02415 [Rathayibacter sp. AY2B3]PPI23975.1 hypothetical protein C5D08_03935 [Rathayibacter sp. AY1B6]PPI31084.1 hypothetical protein C5D34_12795 [Rathayibacter sp. AY1B1]